MNKKENFLYTQTILRLATLGSNGDPHVVPVWYRYRDKKIYIGTNSRTRKVKNITNENRVSFCLDKGIRSPIYGVMGVGTAKIIRNQDIVKRIAQEILIRYFTSLEENSAKELLDDTNCIIEISPHKITSWNF